MRKIILSAVALATMATVSGANEQTELAALKAQMEIMMKKIETLEAGHAAETPRAPKEKQKIAATQASYVPKEKQKIATTNVINDSIPTDVLVEEPKEIKSKGWFEKTKIKGYLQFRNTAWIDGEDKLESGEFKGYWADKSTNKDSNFFIRRARLIVASDVGDHLSIYLQPDFASSTGDTNNIGQLRDFYGDVYLDKTRVHRVRLGQSKVPFSFENMQSSSKRLAHDRNDALNSAARDERDIGAFYYYTPQNIQALFKEIDDKKLKGTGNYGMFGLGAYNGQGANRTELNDNNHIVARLTYPFKTQSGQIFEFGVQGYTGKYVSPNKTEDAIVVDEEGVNDQRVGISAVMYQQPFGIQAEWNWGKTPGADNDSDATTISEKNLQGGYVQLMYRLESAFKDGDYLTPFAKWQYFDGYSKAERNSPYNQVNDLEIGAEWQAAKEVELSMYYHKMNRSDVQQDNGYGERFKGGALRVQVQMNY